MISADIFSALQAQLTPEPNTGCWLWLGDDDGAGVPTFVSDSTPVSVREILWLALSRAEHLEGQLVSTCGVSCCVNPSHARSVALSSATPPG